MKMGQDANGHFTEEEHPGENMELEGAEAAGKCRHHCPPSLAANVCQSVLTIQAWEFPALCRGRASVPGQGTETLQAHCDQKKTLVIYKNTECNRIL